MRRARAAPVHCRRARTPVRAPSDAAPKTPWCPLGLILGARLRDAWVRKLRKGCPEGAALAGDLLCGNRHIKQVIRYALSFRIESDYEKIRDDAFEDRQIDDDECSWWSFNDIQSYVGWLMPKRGGIERIRFVVRPC